MAETEILRVLVGSRAHGLERPDSDYDYSGVFVIPTEDILSLGFDYKANHFIEGNEDNVSYEIGHFLKLSMQCNPTVLSVYLAPQVVSRPPIKGWQFGGSTQPSRWAQPLRALFPKVWHPKRAFDAFTGYASNQRKKMLEKKDNRPRKYAVAYIRTLFNLTELLARGTWNVRVADTEIGRTLKMFADPVADFTLGEIIDEAERLTRIAEGLLPGCKQEPDPAAVNAFLLDIRDAFWRRSC